VTVKASSLALLSALALCACRSWGKVVILVVPARDRAGAAADPETDAQLRERAFASDCEMFLGRQLEGAIAHVPHYRVQHSTTNSYIPLDASMAAPLHVSTPLIVDRSVLDADGLCLFLRERQGAPWRRLALDDARRRDAAASGRLFLPNMASLPELRGF